MNWSNTKKWAKEHGYSCLREKNIDPSHQNEYDYYWSKEDDVNATGLATSVSKLATQIYNHMTNDIHVAYQEQYKISQSQQDINHIEVSGQW